MVMILTNGHLEVEEPYSLEQIFHEWIEYLVNIGQIKKENVNWKLLTEAIVELEIREYVNSGRKLH